MLENETGYKTGRNSTCDFTVLRYMFSLPYSKDVVYDRNQVSVSGNKTKVQIGIGIGPEIFFSETETFFFQSFFKFFLIYPTSWGYKFL